MIGHDTDIGSIDLLNEFRQFETGGLFIQLGGLNPGSQHDQLRSTSLVYLDGRLQVDLFAGFMPQGGDWFRLIDATLDGKVIGQFSQVHLPQLDGDWQLIYGDSYIDLRYNVVPEPSALVLLLMARPPVTARSVDIQSPNELASFSFLGKCFDAVRHIESAMIKRSSCFCRLHFFEQLMVFASRADQVLCNSCPRLAQKESDVATVARRWLMNRLNPHPPVSGRWAVGVHASACPHCGYPH